MKKLTTIVVGFLLLSLLSGCYTEPGEGTSIDIDGHPNATNGTFSWNGHMELGGGIPPQGKYEDISVELYTRNGTLLHKERLGTIGNQSTRLNISITLSRLPYYVFVDSSDIWDGETGIPYYVRSEDAYQGYQLSTISNRSELPITPDG